MGDTEEIQGVNNKTPGMDDGHEIEADPDKIKDKSKECTSGGMNLRKQSRKDTITRITTSDGLGASSGGTPARIDATKSRREATQRFDGEGETA